MKTKFLCLISALSLSSVAYAKGSLTVKPGYNTATGKTKHVAGISIYEKLVGTNNIGFNGWYGSGYEELDDSFWIKADQSLETYSGKFTYGIGISYQETINTPNTDETVIYGKFSTQLW